MNRRTVSSAAFTLVEMLVVAAILAVLASLTAVSTLSAKRKARQAQCLGNLRQHGIALASFVADHNEYPLATSFDVMERYPDHGRFWEGALFPEYLNANKVIQGEPKVLACPTAPLSSELPPTASASSYGYNALGESNNLVTPHPEYQHLGKNDEERRHAIPAVI